MISKRYQKKLSVYRKFAQEYSELKFDGKAALECFEWETYGKKISESDGFAVGKKWLDVTLSMWKEDLITGLLSEEEHKQYVSELK